MKLTTHRKDEDACSFGHYYHLSLCFPSRFTRSEDNWCPPYWPKIPRDTGRTMRFLACRVQLSSDFISPLSLVTALRTGHTVLNKMWSSFHMSNVSKPCSHPSSVKPNQQPWQSLQPLLSFVTTFASLHPVQIMCCKVPKIPCFRCQAAEGVKISPLGPPLRDTTIHAERFIPPRRPKKRFHERCFVEKWHRSFHLKHS